MKLTLCSLLALALCACSGTRTEVVLKLTPEGALLREERAQRNEDSPRDARRARVTQATVECERLSTPLGALAWHTEPIGAAEDPIRAVREIHAAAELAADVLIAWGERELGAEPGWPALRTRIDSGLRRGLEAFSLVAWGRGAAISPEREEDRELVLYASHVLRDALGLPPAEALALVYGLANGSREAQQQLAAWLGRQLGDASPAAAERLAPRCAPSAILASWEAFAQSPQAAALAARAAQEFESSVEPDELWQSLSGSLRWSELRLFEGQDQAGFELELPSQPLWSTGDWDAADKRVRQSLLLAKLGPPRTFGAAWAEPAVDWQRAHFGALVLEGEPLAQYVMNEVGLEPELRKAWNGFLEQLVPGPELEIAIRAWPAPSAEVPDQAALLEQLRSALLGALDAHG